MAMSGDSALPPPPPPDSGPIPESKKKLYVGNIVYSWTEEDLRQVFSAFGTVISARVPQNDKGQSKGFGFVEFSTEEEAAKAVAEMDDKQFGGRTLKVNISAPKPRGSDPYPRRGGDGYGRDRAGYRESDYGGYGGYSGYGGYPGYGPYGPPPAGGYPPYPGYSDYRRDFHGRDYPPREYGARDPREFR
jgi:RNA recognition motif-containing protein